jgi:hypothetical protein
LFHPLGNEVWVSGGIAETKVRALVTCTAKLVLDHGRGALIYAAQHADELLERGDVRGYEIWPAILAVLESARAHLMDAN